MLLFAHGWWFSPGAPSSSTTKTGRHDLAEILLKVALNTKIQIQIHDFFCKLVLDFLLFPRKYKGNHLSLKWTIFHFDFEEVDMKNLENISL
jgi:hypothetical protein